MLLTTRTFNPWGGWRGAWGEMERIRRDMDRVLGAFSDLRRPEAGVFPLFNITEDKDKFTVHAELPGVDPAVIEINVTGKTLTVAGDRKALEPHEGVRFHRRERNHVSFSRAVSLPMDVDGDKVEATSKDGILSIMLPKSETAKPKQISIKTS